MGIFHIEQQPPYGQIIPNKIRSEHFYKIIFNINGVKQIF